MPGQRSEPALHQRGHGAVQARVPRRRDAPLRPRRRQPEVSAHQRQAQRPRGGRAATPITTRSSRCSATGRSATTTSARRSRWAWELLTEGLEAAEGQALRHRLHDRRRGRRRSGARSPTSAATASAASRRRTSGRWATRARAVRAPRSTSTAGPTACDQQGDAAPLRGERRLRRATSRSGTWSSSSTTATPPARSSELPAKHVDTGMGFERIAAVLQGVPQQLRHRRLPRRSSPRPSALVGQALRRRARATTSRCSVIADHARAVTFLVAEGIVPSNEGRGYVLRRLLRRAARHGKLLGIDRPFLHEVVGAVVETMGGAYPEIVARRGDASGEVVRAEEERFARHARPRPRAARRRGRARTRQAAATTLPGDVAFRLYDTYGFPLDLTEDILAGEGMSVDRAGLRRGDGSAARARSRGAQTLRRRRGGARARSSRARAPRASSATASPSGSPRSWRSSRRRARRAARVREGDAVDVVTAETPFYAESGGQVGDRGWLTTDARRARRGARHAQDRAGASIAHRGVVRQGAIAVGDRVRLAIDAARREAARLNHSATHLRARRAPPPPRRAREAGGLAGRSRAACASTSAITSRCRDDELHAIEDEVNAYVRANAEVTSEEMSYDDAIKAGRARLLRRQVRRPRHASCAWATSRPSSAAARTSRAPATSASSGSTARAASRRACGASRPPPAQGAIAEVRREQALLDEIARAPRRRASGEARGKLEKLLARAAREGEAHRRAAGQARRRRHARRAGRRAPGRTASPCSRRASTGSTTRGCARWPTACATASSRASSCSAPRWASARCSSPR